jgi:outer membrane protein assembly factor BamB
MFKRRLNYYFNLFTLLYFFITINLFALAPDILWRQPLGGIALRTPLSQSQSVVVLCDGGKVKAFSSSGKELWEYKSTGKLTPYIARSNMATTYICKTNGEFTALNRSGRVLWNIYLKETITSNPLIGWDGRIFIFLEKSVRCYTETGHLLWNKKIQNRIIQEPLLDSEGGFLTILEDKTILQASAFGKFIEHKLTIMPFKILPVSPAKNSSFMRVLVLYPQGALELYENSENKLTTIGVAKPLDASPVSANASGEFAAIQLDNGKLVFWSGEKKDVLWTAASTVGGKTNIQLDSDGRIYVMSLTGAACFSHNGEELWKMQIGGSSEPPVYSSEGMLYSSGKDWLLYAYRIETRNQVNTTINLPSLGNYGLGSQPSKKEMSELKIIFDLNFDGMLKKTSNSIDAGNLGESEPFIMGVLIGIASGEEAEQMQRLKAIRLIGRIGSREQIPWLLSLFIKTNEPIIQAEIATALGEIGVDPDGKVLDTFSFVIGENFMIRNDTLLGSIAVAIGSLCRFSGPPVSEHGIELLSRIVQNSTSSAVSKIGRDEIESLRFKK